MKIHSTNYTDTFILIADDCPAPAGEIPPHKGEAVTVAALQFEMISKYPYKFTSDDVLFHVFAVRNDLTKGELKEARLVFFAKGQPCFRASPLTKRYGWGIHYDKNGKMALYSSDSGEYRKFSLDKSLNVLKAMNSAKKDRY
ncbi:MAG TPA: DUF6157 family protein [Chitinophagaceae bacterium]|nr:DUF6157 family protein [Chitinophagaceae bacterium]